MDMGRKYSAGPAAGHVAKIATLLSNFALLVSTETITITLVRVAAHQEIWSDP
jgi:hypothetical protein